jgi:hypothetical protein
MTSINSTFTMIREQKRAIAMELSGKKIAFELEEF